MPRASATGIPASTCRTLGTAHSQRGLANWGKTVAMTGTGSPYSPYRLRLSLSEGEEYAAKVRELGGELLAAFEKGDAEYLASLRANQDTPSSWTCRGSSRHARINGATPIAN